MEQDPKVILKPGFNLVGNPRMVHLSYENFHAHANVAKQLHLWNGNHGTQSYFTMTMVDDEAFWSSNQYTGSLIAPMQSFVVINNGTENAEISIDLDGQADTEGDDNRPGENKLRAARQPQNRLYVETEGGLSTAIVMKENASNDLDDMDAPKLFSGHTEGVEVYTVEGNQQLDINFFKEVSYLVPLGLRSNADLRAAGNNKTRLTFRGAESFYEVDVFLKNVATNEEFNLKETQSIDYEMEGHADFGNLFIEFRKAQDVTDDRVATDAGNIQIFAKDNNVIRAVSSMDNPIKEINVMTETGKSLVNAKNLNTSIYDLTVNNGAQIYLVRVVTEREVKVEKVLLR